MEIHLTCLNVDERSCILTASCSTVQAKIKTITLIKEINHLYSRYTGGFILNRNMKLFLLFNIPENERFFFPREVKENYIKLIKNGRTNIPGLKKVDKMDQNVNV